MEAEHWIIDGLKEPFEEQGLTEKEILRANEHWLSEILPEINLYSIESFVFSKQDKIPPKKSLMVFCVYLMLMILRTKAKLKDKQDNFSRNLYLLSDYRTRLNIAIYDLENFDSEIDWKRSIKSSSDRSTGWSEKRQKCALAVDHAKGLWEKGDTKDLPHMLKYLRKESPYKSEKLPYFTLRTMLHPIAEKYGRLFNPNADRGKRTVPEPAQEAASRGVFSISYYCQNCNRSQPMLKVFVGDKAEQSQVKERILCPKCKTSCVYSIEWPDAPREIVYTRREAQLAVDNYNTEYYFNS